MKIKDIKLKRVCKTKLPVFRMGLVVIWFMLGFVGIRSIHAEIVYMNAAPFYHDYEGDIPGIVISNQAVTSSDIAIAIGDESKFKKEGNTITLLTNLLVKWDNARLTIDNEKWIFGSDCLLEVQGVLIIDKSEITSSNQSLDYRGKIKANSYTNGLSRWEPDNYGWVFKITDSKISYMGWVGEWGCVYGGPKEIPVFASNEVIHCTSTPNMGGYIINNWFHDNVQKLSAPGEDAFNSDGNGLINVAMTKGVGLFDGNLIEDCAVNYLSVSWGGGATIANNIYRDIGAIPGGNVFRQKEGNKGTFILNNLFYNGKGFAGYNGSGGDSTANPAILYSGSTHEEWGEVTGNIIHHWPGTPINIVGNGYLGRYDVKCKTTENILFNNNEGITMIQAGFFGSDWPVDVVIKNNSLFDSGSIIGDAVNLVRSGNFIDGSFIDEVPENLEDNFVRLTLAPAAVWYGGRIQTITVAIAGLKPLKKAEVIVETPGGQNLTVPVSGIASTTYTYDYLGEVSTGDFEVGKGIVTVSGEDAGGKNCQAIANFEVRSSEFISRTDIIAGTISGTVTDGTNVIEAVTVNANGYSDMTDSTGDYTITLPAGSYTVKASKNDYLSQLKQVKVTADKITALNFQLTWVGSSDKIFIYPNPYIKGESLNEKIIFGNLPKEATIRIYCVPGEIVKVIKHKDIAVGGGEEWDISGIASGVYIYTIISPSGRNEGKVSIVK